MKYAEAEDIVKSYETLIETIPDGQFQGIKVAKILLLKIDELAHDLAVATEQNGLLREELFGKNKNKEDPDIEGVEDPPNAPEENREREQEARNNVEKAKPKERKQPKGNPKEQQVRRRVPEGLKCSHCHGDVADKGLCHRQAELDIIRLGLIEREYLLHKGQCSCGKVSFQMPGPTRPLEGRKYSSGLVAQLIVAKFKFHLPIYRQQKQFLDAGLYMNRSVMNDLVHAAWKEMEPVVKRLWHHAHAERYRYCDESPIRRVSGKKSFRQFLWCLYTEKAIVFRLTDTRNQKLAKEIIGPGGVIMTDGFGIYCEKSIDGEHGNCLAHLLQKLLRSFSAFLEESEKAIGFLVKIYEVEKVATDRGFSDDDRLVLRQKDSAPITAQLLSYLESLNPPPRSSLGTAIKYAQDRWDKLTYFLKDGGIRIDNNRVEALFRDVKLGLKNYLFVKSDLGGEALAGFCSMIITCELHGINSQTYIAEVLDRLSAGHPASDIDSLMPWNLELEKDPLKSFLVDVVELEQAYPPEKLIRDLGLEGQVYYDPSKKLGKEWLLSTG